MCTESEENVELPRAGVTGGCCELSYVGALNIYNYYINMYLAYILIYKIHIYYIIS